MCVCVCVRLCAYDFFFVRPLSVSYAKTSAICMYISIRQRTRGEEVRKLVGDRRERVEDHEKSERNGIKTVYY